MIEHLITGLALVDLEYLTAFPATPLLYKSGVRYVADKPGQRFDAWRDIPTTIASGGGDCDDLVPWRLAEHWRAGNSRARASVIEQPKPEGGVLYHVFIGGVRGGTEDPSRILGMGRIV